MATVITENELLEALVAANTAPTEARTVTELATLWDWRVPRVRDAIGRLAMQDRIVVHQVQRARVNGVMARVPAYTILPKKRK